MMQVAYRGGIGFTLGISLAIAGCAGMGTPANTAFLYKNISVADGSAVAGEGNNILFKGSPLGLSGTAIKAGDTLRDVKVAQNDLSLINIAQTKGAGKVRIISVVPSLDTANVRYSPPSTIRATRRPPCVRSHTRPDRS